MWTGFPLDFFPAEKFIYLLFLPALFSIGPGSIISSPTECVRQCVFCRSFLEVGWGARPGWLFCAKKGRKGKRGGGRDGVGRYDYVAKEGSVGGLVVTKG